jgi:hypothetical protein
VTKAIVEVSADIDVGRIMPLSIRSASLIRALMYPVQFDANPLDAVDCVMEVVVAPGALDATPAEYRAGIREALGGADRLSTLLPQDHSEEVIRAYLAEVAHRIEQADRK